MKKFLLCLVAFAFSFLCFSCGSDPVDASKIADIDDGDVYDAILGDFYTLYSEAKEATSTSMRFAKMAIAEAKLLESGVMLPMQANGGNYAIGNVVPYSICTTLWGSDEYRYHDALVCTSVITSADRTALKALYAQKKGTGTYLASAKAWLADNGYTLKDSYKKGYSSEPETFDIFASSNAADAEVLVNTYDGLLEYDVEGNQSKMLCTDYSISADGLKYTFTLRNGVKWVDSTGAEYGTVTADDFVAGFQHMLDDPEGGLSWLVDGLIAGVHEYLNGDATDMTNVGVKAIVEGNVQKVEYTLTAPTSYFITMFSYGLFAPLNRQFFLSKGGVFGFGEFAEADNYTYGKTYSDILYCGPYLINSHTDSNEWTFTANNKYWNYSNLNIKTIKWVYNSGEVATQAYDDYKNNLIDGCGLNSASVAKCKEDNMFDANYYVSGTDASAFPAFLNVYRRGYANFNDATKLVSKLTQKQAEDANKAMLNKNFRLAIVQAFDRSAYMAASVGEDLKVTSMVNSYTPGTFVKLDEAISISINGVTKNYPAGTWYGQIMQDQLDADGFKIKAFDAQADGGIGSSSGYDGWFNLEEAKACLDKAIVELRAEGLFVSKANPIYLEYPYQADGSTKSAMAAVVKKSLEDAFDGKVVVVCNETTVRKEQLYAAYYMNLGKQANYNISTLSGWGPDYGDPSSYLDTMIKDGGYMVKCIGLDA